MRNFILAFELDYVFFAKYRNLIQNIITIADSRKC